MWELLAPAGSYESILAAVNAGADAVYAGGRLFGARAYADNPDEEQLIRGIEYCHLHGRKLYLTVNTLLKEQELEATLAPYLEPYYVNGVDGLIVQDLGVMRFVQERFPGLPIHASTQMTVTGPEGARLLQAEGVSRVVAARELSLEEIRGIIAETGIEVETFVHGAMCYSYSGKCLFSSLLGGRSGNRGRCAQPCRLPYQVQGASGGPACYLSMKDLCTLDLLPELYEAGIASLKIEGRMKRPEYTAGVVSVYRKYMDLYQASGRAGYHVEEKDRELLLELFDRGGFSGGYYHTHNGKKMIALRRPERVGADALRLRLKEQYVDAAFRERITGRLVIAPDAPALLRLECRGIAVDCAQEIAQPAQRQPADEASVRRQMEKTGSTPFVFERLEISVADGLFVPVARLNELRRTGMARLSEAILSRSRRDAAGLTTGRAGCEKAVEVTTGHVECKRAAKITVGHADCEEAGAGAVCRALPHEETPQDRESREGVPAGWRRNILVTTEEQFAALLESGFPGIDTIYLDSLLFADPNIGEILSGAKEKGWRCFLNAPAVLRERERAFLSAQSVRKRMSGLDGFLLHTVDELSFFREFVRADGRRALLAADSDLYAYNRRAAAFLRAQGVARFTLPEELNDRELAGLAAEDSELSVYGYQALMQSAQCVVKNTKGCDGVSRVSFLIDRKKVRFPVLNRCLFCYNTIYNSVPLVLYGCRKELRRLVPAYLRLSFTVESGEETLRVLRHCERVLSGEEDARRLANEGTRGHFKRGVE